MNISDWFFFISICFLGALSPGPSLWVIVHNTISEGKIPGYKTSFGHSCGIFFYALSACFFILFLINLNTNLFNFLRIFGVIYLLILGRNLLKKDVLTLQNKTIKKSRNFFLSGFYISFLNPKIGIFFFSLFSQFMFLNNSFLIYFLLAFVSSLVDFLVYVSIVKLITKLNLEKFYNKNKNVISFLFGVVLIFFSIFISFDILKSFTHQ